MGGIIDGLILHVLRFANGYGASVISHGYGSRNRLMELAVLAFDKEGEYSLCYDVPITTDVVGDCTKRDIVQLLLRIRNLKGDII